MANFAERLKELRTEKGLTMEQLADAVKVSIMAISRWESNSRVPNLYAVVELAKFFDVSVGYLAGLEN